MPNQDIPADIIDRAAKIRLACFDVDGTLTDGRLWFDADGREAKAFSVVDGQGLALLRKSGIEVAFVTARNSAAAAHRARDLGVRSCVGVGDKLACVERLARSEEHTSELQSLMRISYAVFCLKKKKIHKKTIRNTQTNNR